LSPVTLVEGRGGNVFNDAGERVMCGGAGADTVDGATNNDTLYGAGGTDTLFGDESNDTVSGGAGWTDTITIQANGLGSGNADWTLALTSGSISSTAAGTLNLTADAAGTITFNDGSQIAFDGMERIQWT
jgi:Ca2+-binding RTX toxin-like protein